MEPEEHRERWPVIGQSDVADFCREICESIVGLERAFEAGELSGRLTSSRFEKVLGPQIYETYGKLAGSAPGPLHHLRVDAVGALLAQLQNDLLPARIAHVQVLTPAESDAWAADPGMDSRPGFPVKIIGANFDEASSTPIRLDQMLDARFWRIGFTFATHGLCDAFAQIVVRRATGRLASELFGLQRILERFNPKTVGRELNRS